VWIKAQAVCVAGTLDIDLRLHLGGITVGCGKRCSTYFRPFRSPILSKISGRNGVTLWNGGVGMDASDASAQVGRIGRTHCLCLIITLGYIQISEIVELHR